MKRPDRFIVILFVILFVTLFLSISAGTRTASDFPSSLAGNLRDLVAGVSLNDTVEQIYRIETDWHNRDLFGNSVAHFYLTGKYTRGMGQGGVRWNDVMIEIYSDSDTDGIDTLRQEWMENFSYQSPYDIARPDFFMDFPSDESAHLLRTLIWDAVAFEVFTWTFFDSLELNTPFIPADFDDYDVPMADWGTFRMKNLKLTWIGISEWNGENCALIDYESLANPVESEPAFMPVTGRSLYWGTIWVSLLDMQIEYATMNEDVIMEVNTSTLPEKKRLNIQREVKFEKID